MYTTVIFDLDGTLLNTLDDLADSVNFALATYGLPTHTTEKVCAFVGNGMQNLMQLAAGKQDKVDQDELLATFKAHYKKHCKDKTKPYDGIIDALEELHAAGYKFAVASNKYQEGTEQLVEKFFGKYGFVSILGQREGKPIKPDPLIVSEAMDGLPGVKLDEVVYCGDSDVDMQTGLGAGVRTIGVTWGFRTREELAAYKPYALIDHPREIADKL